MAAAKTKTKPNNPPEEPPVEAQQTSSALSKEDKKRQKQEEKERKRQEKLDKKAAKKEKKGKGGLIVPVLFLFLLFGALVAIFVFNTFNLRDKYLRPFLEKIPIVKNVLPAAEDVPTDEYAAFDRAQFIDEITRLQKSLEDRDKEIKTVNDKNAQFTDEINRLKEIESQQLQFKADKEAFDKMIAENNPEAYSSFYEKISPENAQALYKEAVVAVQKSKEVTRYMNMIQNMDATSAAKMLEELVITDLNLVVNIINSIKPEIAAEILAGMTPKNAATVIKRATPPQ